MGTVFAELLPEIVAAAVVPIWIIIALFLLRGEGGLAKASAFVAGATSVRLLQGVLFGLVLRADDAAGEDQSGVIVATLLLVLGLLMLIAAYKTWRKEEDPDAPPPKWMTTLSELSPLKAFGMGALLVTVSVKQWVFLLSALAIIDAGQLDIAAGVLLFIIFVVGAQALILTPIILYAVAPKQSAKLLDAAQNFLERYMRAITVAVSLVFGVWFVWKGITGLMG